MLWLSLLLTLLSLLLQRLLRRRDRLTPAQEAKVARAMGYCRQILAAGEALGIQPVDPP